MAGKYQHEGFGVGGRFETLRSAPTSISEVVGAGRLYNIVAIIAGPQLAGAVLVTRLRGADARPDPGGGGAIGGAMDLAVGAGRRIVVTST